MQSSETSLTTSPSLKNLIAQNVIDDTLNLLPEDLTDETEESESESNSPPLEQDFDTDRLNLVRQLKEISLKKKLSEMQNRFIRRKLITYFKKKKVNRAFIDGAKSDMADEEARYEDSLQEFNRTCEKEIQIDMSQKNIEKHEFEIQTQIEILEQKITEYETALTEIGLTLISAKTGELLSEKFVQNVLTRQKKTRDLLSEQRFEFILTEKHANDTQAKLKKLDDLGDGLCMADFEQMRTELQYLTDKIEERNTDLNRLRAKCDADTQKLANIREKRNVVLLILGDEELENENLNMEQHRLRDILNNLRIEYGQMKKKFDKMSHESGLLNRMILLQDYDATLEKVNFEWNLPINYLPLMIHR